VAPAEGQETRLQLASRAVRLQPLLDRQPEELSLAQSHGELRLGKSATKVGKRSLRRRNRDVEAAGGLVGVEGA
jgi:hypothetical protein